MRKKKKSLTSDSTCWESAIGNRTESEQELYYVCQFYRRFYPLPFTLCISPSLFLYYILSFLFFADTAHRTTQLNPPIRFLLFLILYDLSSYPFSLFLSVHPPLLCFHHLFLHCVSYISTLDYCYYCCIYILHSTISCIRFYSIRSLLHSLWTSYVVNQYKQITFVRVTIF